MIPPPGTPANSSTVVTTLRFFGDMNSDSTLDYIEYAYDSANNQITRSATPITQSTKNPPLPFIRNIRPDSVQFRVNTDILGVVTSANITLTVHNDSATASGYSETQLSSRALIPCSMAASNLMYELLKFGGVDKMPSTPSQITALVSQ
jgi:hypothetical protein